MNSDHRFPEDPREGIPDQSLFEADEAFLTKKKERSVFAQFGIGVVGTLLVLTLINISGIHQYFTYSRTPEAATQTPTEDFGAEEISIPLKVFALRDEENLYGTARTMEDIERLVSNADVVWDQGSIALIVTEVVDVSIDETAIAAYFTGPQEFIQSLPGYDKDVVTVVLMRSLQGINGIAFGGSNAIAVADLTTVFDFRVFAHEIGHILSLPHVPQDRRQLMFQGANGFALSLDEVLKARRSAERFVSKE